MSILNVSRAAELSKLLPLKYRETIEVSNNEWKKAIIEEYPKALRAFDSSKIAFWSEYISSFQLIQVFTFQKEELEFLIMEMYNFITKCPVLQYTVGTIGIYQSILSSLPLKKLDIELPWRPLFDLYYNVALSGSKTKNRRTPNSYISQLLGAIAVSRLYFSKEAASEICQELLPVIEDPQSSSYSTAFCTFCRFIPCNYNNHEEWFDILFKHWSYFSSLVSDFLILIVLTSLSAFNYSNIDWGKYIPLIFQRLSERLFLPQYPESQEPIRRETSVFSYEDYEIFFGGNLDPDMVIYQYCSLIIRLFFTKESEMVKKYFENIIKLIMPLHSPLSINQENECIHRSVAFINGIVSQFSIKIKSDKKGKSLLPPLTKEDHRWFAQTLIPVFVLEVYHADNSCEQLFQLLQICPECTLPDLFNTLKVLIKYPHLKNQAVIISRTMLPIALASNMFVNELLEIIKSFVEEISPTNIEISNMIFKVFDTLFWSMPIKDGSYDSWIMIVLTKCIEFSTAASGKDFQTSLIQMESMLTTLINSLSPYMRDNIEKYIFDSIEILCLDSLPHIIDSLSIESLNYPLFKHLDERNSIILKCLVRSSSSNFIRFNINNIIDYVVSSFSNKKTEIKKHNMGTIKWALKALTHTYPLHPKRYGLSSINENSIPWKVPDERDISLAMKFIDTILSHLKLLFKSSDWKIQKDSIMFIKSILKGLIGAVDSKDLGEDLSSKKGPKLFSINFPEVSKKLVEIIDWLISNMNHNHHHAVISEIINSLKVVMIPVDVISNNEASINDKFNEICNESKLSVYYKSIESMLPIHHYWYSLKLYTLWLCSIPLPFTTFLRKIIMSVLAFSTSPYDTIRISITDVLKVILSRYNLEVSEFLSIAFENFKTIEWTNIDSLSTSALPVLIFSLIDNGPRHFKTLVDIAIHICRETPSDVPSDVVRSLQVSLSSHLQSINYDAPPYNTQEIYYERKRLIHELARIGNSRSFTAEIEGYISSFIYGLIPGIPSAIDLVGYQYLTVRLVIDDVIYRKTITESFAFLIEVLIPRIPFRERKEYKAVNKSNWEDYKFADNRIRKVKRESIIMSREQSMNPEFLSLYFSDSIQDRIDVHKFFYSQFLDSTDYLREIFIHFTNEQVHEEEEFLYHHFCFWNSLVRFFGPPLVSILISIINDEIGDFTNIPMQYSALECIAGILSSTTCFTFSQIESIQAPIFNFMEKILCNYGIESRFSWPGEIFKVIGVKDPRRFFWLREYVETLGYDKNIPLTKYSKQVSDRVVFLVTLGFREKDVMENIFSKHLEKLFSSKALQFDQARYCVIEAVYHIFYSIFRSHQEEEWHELAYTLFYDYIIPSNDEFISQWLLKQFEEQSFSGLSVLPFCYDNIEVWSKLIEDKDEDEQEKSHSAISCFLSSSHFLSKDKAQPIIECVLEQLSLSNKPWTTQVYLLEYLSRFIGSVLFFIEADTVVTLINNVLNPSLRSPHPAVQDTASTVLAFVFRSIKTVSHLLPQFAQDYGNKAKSNDPSDVLYGTKGLFAIIWSTVLFDEIPDYIVSAFQVLSDLIEIHGTAFEPVNTFLCDFWAQHDENITEKASSKLIIFRDSLKASYLS